MFQQGQLSEILKDTTGEKFTCKIHPLVVH